MNSDYKIAYTSHFTANAFQAVLGTCAEELRDACIDKVQVEIDGVWKDLVPSTLQESEVSCGPCSGRDGLWSGNPNAHLPSGHRPSRWTGNGFSVGVGVTLFGFGTESGDIDPIADSNNKTGSYITNLVSLKINPEQGLKLQDAKYRLLIEPRLQREAFKGFFDGRLRDGEIAELDGGVFSFTGNPALVSRPTTPTWNFADVPQPIKDMFSKWVATGNLSKNYDLANLTSADPSFGFSFNNNVDQFLTIEPYFQQTLTKDVYVWSLSNQGTANLASKSKCFSGALGIGMATTNASMYTEGLPQWDSSTSSLRYFLASPHLTEKNVEAVGNYDLSLSEEVAKCIWGISEIPAVASIAIMYSDGQSEVGTVTLGVNAGYVNFHVNGFHFSTPTISVKLVSPPKKEDVVPTPTPTPVESKPTPKPTNKAKTITCKKNKKVIKIVGSTPKCPTGYKLLK